MPQSGPKSGSTSCLTGPWAKACQCQNASSVASGQKRVRSKRRRSAVQDPERRSMSGYRRCRRRWMGNSPRRAEGRLRGIAPSVVGHGGKLQNQLSGGYRISGATTKESIRPISSPPTPIPSAVDPHTVEQARCRASRWSASLYERPGRPVPCLLGLSWVDGGRDGSSPPPHPTGRHPRAAPPPSRSRSAPAGGMSVREREPRRRLGARLMPSGLSHSQGRASAQRARSGPKAGASRGAEPGSPPGGAERGAGCLMK